MNAPASRFRSRLLPKGTAVIACAKYHGIVDGMTDQGDYIVELIEPVRFPTLGIQVERVSFCPSVIVEAWK